MIEAQNHRIEAIRCDNVKENINDVINALLKEKGIQWERTVPNNPHQNGVAKRAFRTIFNRVRACLIDSKLPRYLWREACHIVVDLKNISSCTLLSSEKKTPHEVWKGSKSNLAHLHSFETLCYSNREKAKKLEDQGVKCQLLGYEASNQYRLWDITKQQLIRAAHVSFDEYTTPPEAVGETSDFDYITLDFMFERTEAPRTASEPAAAEERHTEQPQPSEPPARPGNAENDVFEAPDASPESHDLQPAPQTSPQPAPIAPPAGPAPGPTTQTAAPASGPSTQPAAPAPAEAPGARYPQRNRQTEDYALVQNPWNSRRGGNINDPSNEHRAKRFSARIRKVRCDTKYVIPQTWDQVMAHEDAPKWFTATQSEYNNQMRNDTWRTIVSKLEEKVIGGRWVFSLKYDIESNIVRYKARWVAQSFKQVKGLDYNEIFSEVIKSMIWKALLAYAARYDLEAHHVDIITTFLKANLKERILVKQPSSFLKDLDAVCELLRALYDLKQSSREWYECLKDFLLSIDFERLFMNHFVFVHPNDIIVVVYVDDHLIIESSIDDIVALKKQIAKRFQIKNLNDVSQYLSVKVVRDRFNRTMWLTQTSFIRKLVDDCDLTNCRLVSTLMESYPLQVNVRNGREYRASKEEISSYQEILSSLQWLVTMTRQDIAYVVNKLAHFNLNSTSTHFIAIQRVVRYLAGISKLSIRFEPSNNLGQTDDLIEYIDAFYVDDADTKRSHSNYVFLLWNESINCSSKRQNTVATSTIEVEYIDQCNAAKKAYFLAHAFDQLDYTSEESIDLKVDNQSVIKLANNSVNHAKSKHIAIQYHYVREQIEKEDLKLTYININDMVVDGLTKALTKNKFKGYVTMLRLIKSGAFEGI